MTYLALDPGNATGWAKFKDNGDADGIGTCNSKQEVYELLRSVKPDAVICEDWITRGHTTFGGDHMHTARIIGAIEFYVYLRSVPLILQPNTVKPIAYKWAGITKPKTKSLTHETDAYCHGVYYLQKNGIRRPQQGASRGS